MSININRIKVGVYQDQVPVNFKKTGIYFISDQNGHIKIGKTTNLGRRFYELQTGNPFALKLIQFYELSEHDISTCERMLHNEFKNDRLNGEWFNEQPVFDFLIFMDDVIMECAPGHGRKHLRELIKLRNKYYAENYAHAITERGTQEND